MNDKRNGYIGYDSWLYIAGSIILGIFLVAFAENWLGQLGIAIAGGSAILLLLLMLRRKRK